MIRMIGVRKFINKLSNTQKIIYAVLMLALILLISIGIPTLARYKNRNTIITAPVWDGSIANSYRRGDGTEDNPYIISNGAELAYFAIQLLETNYENTYFALSNDIILNKGLFVYDSENGIKYILDGQEYYLENYSNKYYDNIEQTGDEIGTVNTFNVLKGFKGYFDGRSYTIFGLYITDADSAELGFFTELEGNIKDLYVDNALIYGGIITGGIASTATNTSITNVLFNGYVISKNENIIRKTDIHLTNQTIDVSKEGSTSYIDLTNKYPFVGSNIISTIFTGNYTINDSDETETTIKINDQEISGGSFAINLGDTLLDEVSIWTSTISNEGVTISFSDLNYQIIYGYGIAGGIVGRSNNTTIVNTINKAYVYGYSVSGGIVGVTTNLLNINQSYNNGNIVSDSVSGGLIGVIEKSDDNINISKSYNSGHLNALNIGGLIGIVSNNIGVIFFDNVFDVSQSHSVDMISNAYINVGKAYHISEVAIKNGETFGDFERVTLSDLQSKSFVMENLSFKEFIDFNDLKANFDNVWVYEDESLPILFVDDLNNPIANIHAGIYTWNNFTTSLNPYKFIKSNITFTIEEVNDFKPIDEKYYYISNGAEPLNKDELLALEEESWIPYNDGAFVQIVDPGIYVIYAKLVNYHGNETYLNSDILILDPNGPDVDISLDSYNWNDLRSELGSVYIDRAKNIMISANNEITGIINVQYYITDKTLNKKELEALSDNEWIDYDEEISISEKKTYVVYVKVIDDFGFISYFNTDYIVFDGYQLNSLKVGRNNLNYLDEEPNISSKSTVTMNFSYNNPSKITENHTHHLVSNVLLPLGTKITLIDNVKNKIYSYQITTEEDIYHYHDSCDDEDLTCEKKAFYPFTLFKETGTVNKLYIEDSYYDEGLINENFTVILDFSNTNIDINYSNVLVYLELHDSEGINVRPTLYDTLEEINIYATIDGERADATLSLTTDYSGSGIIYDSDSTTDINITSQINYKQIDDVKIIDTSYEDKKMGIAIKLVDSEGQIIEQKHFKNMIFKINDERYYPGKDNIVRIALSNEGTNITQTLTIITKEDNVTLKEGTYYLKISNYASYDGYLYEELITSEISIPILVMKNNFNIPHSFDVIMDNTYRIIEKTEENKQILFKILQNGPFDNPSIRVSLYKKDQMTAYDQNYSLVDLKGYITDELNKCSDKIYYVTTEPIFYDGTEETYNNFELNLITDNFENGGYKFIFTLYDGTTKIGTIEKYFIVK